MFIDIHKDDLQTLRSALYEQLWRLAQTPAASSKDPNFRRAVEPQMEVLRKTIRKLNRALVKAYGHDCCAEAYPLENLRPCDQAAPAADPPATPAKRRRVRKPRRVSWSERSCY